MKNYMTIAETFIVLLLLTSCGSVPINEKTTGRKNAKTANRQYTKTASRKNKKIVFMHPFCYFKKKLYICSPI